MRARVFLISAPSRMFFSGRGEIRQGRKARVGADDVASIEERGGGLCHNEIAR